MSKTFNFIFMSNTLIIRVMFLLLLGYPAPMPRAQYQFPSAAAANAEQHPGATYTPSAPGATPSSVAFHSADPNVYGGSTSPMYAAISPHAPPQVAQYAPTSSQTVVSAPAAYTR